jgi:glycerate kinase
MRILIAPDKFKSSLTAPQVARAIARGLLARDGKLIIDECPLADGGEGTVQALVAATGGSFKTQRVTGPLPDMKVDATFGLLGTSPAEREPSGSAAGPNPLSHPLIAVIEMAAASGLHLLPDEDRNPANTTTFGTGELLLHAARAGASKIILGIGGSATIDAGIGCCQAAGLPVILDEIGPADPHEPLVGSDLARVVLIKHARGSPLDRIPIEVASDVTNPLYGPTGAARIFGPQKGATPRQVDQFDDWLRTLAARCGADDVAQKPGAGAAGGLGFAMMAFFKAHLRPGFQIVAQAVLLRDRVQQADLVITGEGRLDASSLHGKVPVSVAALCTELNKPCIAIAGTVERSIDWKPHFAQTHALTDIAADTPAAIAQAAELLARIAPRALRE